MAAIDTTSDDNKEDDDTTSDDNKEDDDTISNLEEERSCADIPTHEFSSFMFCLYQYSCTLLWRPYYLL